MIFVLNGPNLGRLGTREPDVYGSTSYADLVELCESDGAAARRRGERAADRRGVRDDRLAARGHRRGAHVVLNPAAWTHYNIAIRDACVLLRGRLVEVHISNIHAREAFRHHSVISAVATGVIMGLGIDGYRLALEHVAPFAGEG